jgi:hypothetical protein
VIVYSLITLGIPAAVIALAWWAGRGIPRR